METHDYTVNLDWQYARLGRLSSADLTETIEVATPPEFPKGMPGIWSPEHLLVAAVSSCFMTTFLAIAENSKLNFEDFDCRAIGKLENVENKLLISEIKLFPHVLLNHEGDVEKAQRVLQKTEQACLITNSVKSNVTMEPKVQVSIQVYD
ncbi:MULTISPECIES: OsmC family protein [unclassified Spirosoma]|uniref:OsmC family protein n=1 Tax=unclassified Spirosoma TaxID=2621999 RepID=UPI00095EE0F8|nr:MULTISPECIES: OsmC family protein [unclassified Spirosoma]MBN8824193.1 OsmC family protein [Spirosoma sp.]OJW78929.1 MAG: osmotically inducible protein OsmC [Spirosoma sp. 48-14]